MSTRAGSRLTRFDALVVLAAAIFTIAWFPRVTSSITPRVAVLVALAPVGFVLAVRAAIRRDRAAALALAALAGMVISALLSPDVVYSIKGGIAHSSTVVVVGASLLWWALGRRLSDAGRVVLPWALVAGLALSVVIATIQVGVGIESGPLSTFSGRGSGLFQNPVYYGSVVVGLATWSALRLVGRPLAIGGVALAAIGGWATGLSGSRAAVVALLLVVAAVTLRDRRPAAWTALGAIAAGVVVSSVFSSALAERSTVGRIAGQGEGPAERLSVWGYGAEAFLDRPVFGWGLNHFGSAVQGRFDAEFVTRFGWDSAAQPWTHPHNLVVFLLVSLGLVGTALLAAFVVAALGGRRNLPLLGGALAIAGTWMLQPTTVHSMPIALLLLGAAVRPRRNAPDVERQTDADRDASASAPDPLAAPDDVRERSARTLMITALLVGVVAAGYLFVGDLRLYRSGNAGDTAAAEAAAAWFPRDPYVSDFVSGQFELAARRGEPAALERSVEWAERSVDIAPDVPILWNRLAGRRLNAGEPDGALEAIERALDLSPVDTTAHTLLVIHAGIVGDDAAYEAALAAACDLELPICSIESGPEAADGG